jgi:uncharacterized protein
MAEVIIPGPAGRIEARFTEPPHQGAAIALVLHPHPKAGGTMQDPITIRMFQMFEARGFGVLRYNSRGVGRTQGQYDNGVAELEDAAFILDYLENLAQGPRYVWCAGYSFGAWITLQLLMRRPEIDGFFAVSPPVNHFDLSFLAPCPASGLIIIGDQDAIATPDDVDRALQRVRVQQGESIDRETVEGANHFYQTHQDALIARLEAYLDARIAAAEAERGEGEG